MTKEEEDDSTFFPSEAKLKEDKEKEKKEKESSTKKAEPATEEEIEAIGDSLAEKKSDSKSASSEKSIAEKDNAPMNILPYIFNENKVSSSVSQAEAKAMKGEV